MYRELEVFIILFTIIYNYFINLLIYNTFFFFRNFSKNREGLSNKVWTALDINSQSKQKLSDGWNCGVYCAKYLDLLSSGSLNLKFPSTYPALAKIRSEMYTVLSQSK